MDKNLQDNNQTISQKISTFTIKQWVLFGITVITALFMLIGLAFTVMHVEFLGISTTVTGFDLIAGKLPQILESVAGMLVLFAWLHLFATIYCISYTAIAFAKFSEEKLAKAQKRVMIISLAFSVLFMIDGIIAVNAVEYNLEITNNAYLLFILTAIFAVCYFVCVKFLPETISSANKPKAKYGDAYVTDQLKKYKELYDIGAISAEEYEKKKTELLNN